jgi:hypothetical protein
VQLCITSSFFSGLFYFFSCLLASLSLCHSPLPLPLSLSQHNLISTRYLLDNFDIYRKDYLSLMSETQGQQASTTPSGYPSFLSSLSLSSLFSTLSLSTLSSFFPLLFLSLSVTYTSSRQEKNTKINNTRLSLLLLLLFLQLQHSLFPPRFFRLFWRRFRAQESEAVLLHAASFRGSPILPQFDKYARERE